MGRRRREAGCQAVVRRHRDVGIDLEIVGLTGDCVERDGIAGRAGRSARHNLTTGTVQCPQVDICGKSGQAGRHPAVGGRREAEEVVGVRPDTDRPRGRAAKRQRCSRRQRVAGVVRNNGACRGEIEGGRVRDARSDEQSDAVYGDRYS